MTPELGDVVVRARGLSLHLLTRETLVRLARSAWSGVLAGALQDLGYWPAPSETRAPRSAAELIDDAIEHETARRLAVLARWLAERRAAFAAVFEDEERRALRVALRHIADRASGRWSGAVASGIWALPRRLRLELAACERLREAVAAVQRARSPYAAPLRTALRSSGESPLALEAAIDGAFAERSVQAAAAVGGRLSAWVAEGIDLENAWDALAAGGGRFLDGGAWLSRDRHAAIAREPSVDVRCRRLARVFSRSALAPVFADPYAPPSSFEDRARAARLRAERRAARVDPLGPSALLEVFMRIGAERADLRRINWAVAQGIPTEAIAGQLVMDR